MRLTFLVFVSFCFQSPNVRSQCFVARGLLCDERSLVLRDLRQIVQTVVHGTAYRCKLRAVDGLCAADRSRTFVTVGSERVDTLTIGAGGFGSTVGHHQIVAVIVSVLFLRTFKCALDVFDAGGTDGSFCHMQRRFADAALALALALALVCSTPTP